MRPVLLDCEVVPAIASGGIFSLSLPLIFRVQLSFIAFPFDEIRLVFFTPQTLSQLSTHTGFPKVIVSDGLLDGERTNPAIDGKSFAQPD